MRHYFGLLALFAVNGLSVKHHLGGLTTGIAVTITFISAAAALLCMELYLTYRRHRP